MTIHLLIVRMRVRVRTPNYIIYDPYIVLSFSHDALIWPIKIIEIEDTATINNSLLVLLDAHDALTWPIKIVEIEDTATTNNSLLMLLHKASTAKLSSPFIFKIKP